MILAGDIGGTKTVLGLFQTSANGQLTTVREQTYNSTEFSSFEDLLSQFTSDSVTLTAACFGIAGPVIEQRCVTTNLPWVLDAKHLADTLSISKVQLLNDLEATAYGMLHLTDDDFLTLNPNAVSQAGNRAVIAAGTGLGEALLHWDGEQHRAIATEGGHCDFAPQTPTQDQLLVFLRQRYPEHVSWERVVSGVGFSHIYDFLAESGYASPSKEIPAAKSADSLNDARNAIISELGLKGEDPLCRETLRLFVELYGAEAGNLVLKSFAIGGLYIGGGIAPKIRQALEDDGFLNAFISKGRYRPIMDKIPVKLSLNPRTALLGAAHFFNVKHYV